MPVTKLNEKKFLNLIERKDVDMEVFERRKRRGKWYYIIISTIKDTNGKIGSFYFKNLISLIWLIEYNSNNSVRMLFAKVSILPLIPSQFELQLYFCAPSSESVFYQFHQSGIPLICLMLQLLPLYFRAHHALVITCNVSGSVHWVYNTNLINICLSNKSLANEFVFQD